ncbi:MAG: hypothetical protein ABIJ56_01990 [Pseudomonadota bacterium]
MKKRKNIDPTLLPLTLLAILGFFLVLLPCMESCLPLLASKFVHKMPFGMWIRLVIERNLSAIVIIAIGIGLLAATLYGRYKSLKKNRKSLCAKCGKPLDPDSSGQYGTFHYCGDCYGKVDKRKKILSIILLLIAGLVIASALAMFVLVSGCQNYFMARIVHNKVSVGMPAAQVVSSLKKYNEPGLLLRSFLSYRIKLTDGELNSKCIEPEPAFKECLEDDFYLDCVREYPSYKKCFLVDYEPSEFLDIVEKVAKRRVDYVIYEARIDVCFVGPVFLKNDFEITLDEEGKVKEVSAVRSWD